MAKRNAIGASRKGGRPRQVEITVQQIAAMDPPDIRLMRAHLNGFDIIETAVDGTTREKYRKIETPFDHAKRHGWISPHQHRAAEILATSFTKAGMLPRVTMAWTSFVDGGSQITDGTDARDRHIAKFRAAVDAMPDEYRDGFLTWFIEAQSEDISVEQLGALFTRFKHKEARKSIGVLVLKSVLNHLSFHYGVMSEKQRQSTVKIS